MPRNPVLFAALSALAGFGLVITPVAAKPRKARPKPPAATPVASPVAAPVEAPDQQQQAANAAQAKAAQDQVAANAAAQLAYQEAVKARDEKIARDKAEYEAKIASDKAAHDAIMQKWQADVAACKAGDVSRCAKPN